jgi:hypothetical protein
VADRVPATLQQLQDWARRGEIPGTAILNDGQGRLIADFWHQRDELLAATSFVTDKGKTLADLTAFAAAEMLPGSISLALYGLSAAWEVLGFSSWEEGPGEWYVTLETAGQAR